MGFFFQSQLDISRKRKKMHKIILHFKTFFFLFLLFPSIFSFLPFLLPPTTSPSTLLLPSFFFLSFNREREMAWEKERKLTALRPTMQSKSTAGHRDSRPGLTGFFFFKFDFEDDKISKMVNLPLWILVLRH